MALTKLKIGSFVELFSERCGIPNLLPIQVSGINIDKEFFEPARQIGNDTSNYKVVPPDYFACNLMHVGRDEVLPIALNHTRQNKIVSPAYTVFKINETKILKEYFFILIKSHEKDRYFWFHTDGSIRQGLPWEDFCDIEITLPSLEVQQKFVDIYLAMQKNLEAYQSKTEDLKLVCDGYIEDLKRKLPSKKIGDFIEEYDERNSDLIFSLNDIKGVSINKEFIETKADMNGVPLKNYKVTRPGMFVFNVNTARMGDKFAVAFCDIKPHIVSSIYGVFRSKDKEELLPEYLFIFFKRSEFDRYVRFHSWGSAREVFTMDDMKEVAIPIPDIKTQQEIVNIHKCYIERLRIAEKLKEQLKDICPVLIKGSLQTEIS